MPALPHVPKERPILFSGPMVRALLDGSKTQTRRIVKQDPARFTMDMGGDGVATGWVLDAPRRGSAWLPIRGSELLARCPYGVVGDRLWVRETWYCDHVFVGNFETTRTGYIGKTLSDQECIAEWRGKPIPQDLTEEGHMMYYRADGEAHDQFEQLETPFAWRPSIHMPRWASRITLEVTGVRVERLQDITEEDARAEGVEPRTAGQDEQGPIKTHRTGFVYLWQQINGERANWLSNPWVWVVEFKRVA